MKAFGDETTTFAEHTINAVNNVSNHMAVSSSDITTALTKTSSAMSVLGNDYNQTIALVTAGAEQMQGQSSKVARGLRTIGNNIANLAQEQEELTVQTQHGAKSIELFNKETGEMKSTYDIISQLSDAWKDMSLAQKQALGISLAGKNQFEVFSAVLNQFSDAELALTYAIDSQSSAWDENAKYMESIEAKQQKMKQQISELVLGEGGLQKFYKTILDVGNALLKLANNSFVQTTVKLLIFFKAVKMLAGTEGLGRLSVSVKYLFDMLQNGNKIIPSLVSAIMSLSGSVNELNIANGLTVMSTKELGVALKSLLAIELNPIVLAVTAIAFAFTALKLEAKQSSEALQKGISEVNDELSEQEQHLNNVKNYEQQLKELDKSDFSSIEEYEDKTRELERQIILEQKLADEAEREARAVAESARNAKTSGSVGAWKDGSERTYSGRTEVVAGRQLEDVKRLTSDLKDYDNQMKALATTTEEYNALSSDEKDLYDDLQKQYDVNKNSLNDVNASLAKNIQAMETWIALGMDTDGSLKKIVDDYYNLQKSVDNVNSELKSSNDVYEALGMTMSEVQESFGDAEEEYGRFQEYMANEDWASAYSLAVQYCVANTVDLEEALNSTLDELSNIEDAYNSLTAVINDYNDNGVVSLDNINKILTKYPQYIQYLQLENGQLTINKEGLDAIAKARIQDAEMLAYRAYMAREDEIAQADNNNKVVESVQVSQSFVNATNSEITALGNIIKALKRGEDSWDKYWTAESKGKYKYNRRENRIAHEENLKNLHTTLSLLESAGGATGSYTSAIDANTNAKSKNTSATKDNNKALEEEIKQYEKVIKYIKSKFDEEIDRIKELKTTEIDSIKERIDALGDLRDAELDAIQVKIDALNEENDALGEQLELQQLLDNLAKAKSSKVKIYRDGRFVYDQDQEQVSEAQKALNEYYAKKRLQDQIKALEDYKDSVKKNYDKQIDDLKAFQKEREKYYDAQIKYWQDYKKNFENMVNAYENEQNRLLALQMTGIDFEAQGWQSRLGNLQSFVNSYIDLLRQQVNATRSAQAEIEAIQSQGSGGGRGWNGGSVTISNGGSIKNTYTNKQGKEVLKPYYQKQAQSKARTAVVKTASAAQATAKILGKIGKHASGSNYIKADELAVVGEDPHKEIVIGSNLNTNSGVMMNLQKGSGVVPATATSSLMALADKIRANGVNATANDLTSSGEVVNMDIANVNVKADNADEFVQSMREFKLSMLQRTYK